MTNSKMARSVAELERIFFLFRGSVFSPCAPEEFPLPVMTIQSAGTGFTDGWFAEDRWIDKHKSWKKLPEINIAAEHLSADVTEICHTVLHEMVHYANWLKGIRDCSSNNYHNKKFRRACENVGLVAKLQDGRGYAATQLTPELRALISTFDVDASAFDIFRLQEQRQQRKRVKRVNYYCACHGTNLVVRAANSPLHAVCEMCQQRFQRRY